MKTVVFAVIVVAFAATGCRADLTEHTFRIYRRLYNPNSAGEQKRLLVKLGRNVIDIELELKNVTSSYRWDYLNVTDYCYNVPDTEYRLCLKNNKELYRVEAKLWTGGRKVIEQRVPYSMKSLSPSIEEYWGSKDHAQRCVSRDDKPVCVKVFYSELSGKDIVYMVASVGDVLCPVQLVPVRKADGTAVTDTVGVNPCEGYKPTIKIVSNDGEPRVTTSLSTNGVAVLELTI